MWLVHSRRLLALDRRDDIVANDTGLRKRRAGVWIARSRLRHVATGVYIGQVIVGNLQCRPDADVSGGEDCLGRQVGQELGCGSLAGAVDLKGVR